jgi:hypothetical protein
VTIKIDFVKNIYYIHTIIILAKNLKKMKFLTWENSSPYSAYIRVDNDDLSKKVHRRNVNKQWRRHCHIMLGIGILLLLALLLLYNYSDTKNMNWDRNLKISQRLESFDPSTGKKRIYTFFLSIIKLKFNVKNL